MIVDCALYKDGRRLTSQLTPEEAAARHEQEGDFVWIGLHEPTPEEFETVRQGFGLHELAVEDAIHAHQRPKLERYGDSLFVVLKTARYVDEEECVEFGEILIFLGERFILVVRHGLASGLKELRSKLEENHEFLANGPSAVLHGIVDKVVDDYVPVTAGIEDDIEEVEQQVFSVEGTNPVERIYYLKREVLELRRATAPFLTPLNHLATHSMPLVKPEVREYFRDVYDHMLRISEQIDAFRDLLTGVLEANMTQTSIRQNEDMRKISAWVAIAVVPTMIAGVYGMNFEYMPELRSPYGYPSILALMAAACTALYVFFRRRGWL
ncbi:MAG TPA: magnesium/cobalt transporter CorA [Vicinamibacteria bacterium]|nr:magnesium/cobalt transporter CorA [Vicinamibacteria bacterium]